VVLKVAVFDDTDLAWALGVHRAYPHIPFYLSAATNQDPRGELDLLETTSARYRWLCEAVAGEPELHRAVVLPQLHVIAWGSRVGV
jgi:7-carboxy-7-deazaguanine synthase